MSFFQRCFRLQSHAKVLGLALIIASYFALVSYRHVAGARTEVLKAAVLQAQIATNQVEPFVVVTAATYPYRKFVFNLWCSLRKHGKRKLLIMSLDRFLHEYALIQGIPSVYFPSDRATNELEKFGTEDFKRLVIAKLYAVRAVLHAGVNVFFVDSDTAFCNDPEVIMRDVQKRATERGTDFVMQRFYGSMQRQVLNSGVYYARATNHSRALIDALIASNPQSGDQAAFNTILCGRNNKESRRIFGMSNDTGAYETVGCMWNNRTTVSFLSQRQFPIGCSKIDGRSMRKSNLSMVQRMCTNRQMTMMHVSCWLAHDKKEALQIRGLWYTRKYVNAFSFSQEECLAS